MKPGIFSSSWQPWLQPQPGEMEVCVSLHTLGWPRCWCTDHYIIHAGFIFFCFSFRTIDFITVRGRKLWSPYDWMLIPLSSWIHQFLTKSRCFSDIKVQLKKQASNFKPNIEWEWKREKGFWLCRAVQVSKLTSEFKWAVLACSYSI